MRILKTQFLAPIVLTIFCCTLFIPFSMAQSSSTASPQFSNAVAFDVSPPLSSLPQTTRMTASSSTALREIRPERGPIAKNKGFSGDAALQRLGPSAKTATIPSPLLTFEGLSNQDNFNLYGFRVNPPDPVGDVGPNNYVEMVNLAFAVYDKQGNVLAGPIPVGNLWAGFAIDDCTDPSGDAIVVYDQFVDRWILTQFTTRGLSDPTLPFYNCVAVSQTGDPTGTYFRYAFITSAPGSTTFFFPDYPKYSVWTNSYVLTSRDFGPTTEYGISVYALEKSKMIIGDPNARSVHFFLDSAVVPINLIGDGLLPADIDGKIQPRSSAAIPIFGTQDDDGPYGATFDALNIWDLSIQWKTNPKASLVFRGSFPVAPFDSIFPCGAVPGSQPPSARDCLPQPGITDGSLFLDILSYRQRPTYRLAYRNFVLFEDMVTAQSVEALPGVAGMRWYEVLRLGSKYFVVQQGTYAPADGVHRWMGSVAMDKIGNMAMGYSVVNGVDVFPGIRYTGRRRFDPLNQMSLGEGTIIAGSGVQTTTNSRWGDYTSMNIDPTDDCTFWYVNEYYQVSGFPIGPGITTTAPWQTRIGSFKLPGCH
jgi:hypothetical protein